MTEFLERENLWGYRKRLRFVLGSLRDAFPTRFPNALRVLDVGCGNGSQLALPLVSQGVAVTGIDTDEVSIAHARELAHASPTAHFLSTSIDDLTEGEFDAVILSEVLEHVTNPRELLRSSIDHASKNGIIIVTTPNGYGEFEWDSWLFRLLQGERVVRALARNKISPVGATDNHSSGHIQFFTRQQLFKIFAACGLELWREQPATLFAGPIAGHSLARSQRFVEWNAGVADGLPMVLASGWYFALRRIGAGTAE